MLFGPALQLELCSCLSKSDELARSSLAICLMNSFRRLQLYMVIVVCLQWPVCKPSTAGKVSREWRHQCHSHDSLLLFIQMDGLLL